MTTDKELLELAANAGEIFITKKTWESTYTEPWKEWLKASFADALNTMVGIAFNSIQGGSPPSRHVINWNPLLDDGDALRLAAKLCVDFRTDYADRELRASCASMGQMGHPCPGEDWEIYVEVKSTDIGTTQHYRRAVVMLAAAIGRSMK